ncbi:MAG: N-acetylmannosamine-6-phosphate 2-epimerase [Anaerolineales bacterium]|nr:N-acetylmannosamine-6-phosphate 2-epimerase [Anaerolineales bacterium]
MKGDVLDQIQGGIIVSCQALPEDSTYGPEMMAIFARSAERGGAVGIRANSAEDVAAIRAVTDLPIIGIWKRSCPDEIGYIITPTLEDARLLKDAGASLIAADVADRPRPGDLSAVELIKGIHSELQLPIMADCFTLEDALHAQNHGADVCATTLALPESLGEYEPNLALLQAMVERLEVPVIAEGRFWDPTQVQEAFALGAHAVVIGSAVTRPWMITERFVKQGIPRR